MFYRPVFSVLVISLLLVLGGCGQKSALYLPVSKPEKQKTAKVVIPEKALLPRVYG